MYRKAILSVMTGLLAAAISTGVAMADPVQDAQRLNAAKDRVSRDNLNLNREQAQKQRDIDNFANSVRQNNLGSAVRDVIDIENEKQVIQRQRRQQNFDRFEQGNAQRKLNSDFR
jgi:TolA-binding protein